MLDEETELEETLVKELELFEEDELDKLDALLVVDELTALEELDEFIGGELEPPPPHAASNKEKTMGDIKCTRAS